MTLKKPDESSLNHFGGGSFPSPNRCHKNLLRDVPVGAIMIMNILSVAGWSVNSFSIKIKCGGREWGR